MIGSNWEWGRCGRFHLVRAVKEASKHLCVNEKQARPPAFLGVTLPKGFALLLVSYQSSPKAGLNMIYVYIIIRNEIHTGLRVVHSTQTDIVEFTYRK